MPTIITTQKQADTITRQLAHIRAQVQRGESELDQIRNQITTAIMVEKSTVDLLSKRSRVDSDLQAHRQGERDLAAALEAWQATQRRQQATEARRALEAITAEGREIERQLAEVMHTEHDLQDRIDALRNDHHRALVAAREAGALGDGFGNGQPISPAPAYPRVHRPLKPSSQERMPDNLAPVNISLDEFSAARHNERMGA